MFKKQQCQSLLLTITLRFMVEMGRTRLLEHRPISNPWGMMWLRLWSRFSCQ